MRKLLVFLIVFSFVAGTVLVTGDEALARRKSRDKKEDKADNPDNPEGELIYKFKNEEEIRQFEQLYVSKQATYGRMGVLQAYFAMEQNNINQIDEQMQKNFGFRMDPNKTYDLNRDMMEIRESTPVVPETE